MELPPEVLAKIDARLRAKQTFTYEAIEEALVEHYTIGDDVPTVEDDEMHNAVSALHLHYVNLGLAREGE
jgi:hypothetical protein